MKFDYDVYYRQDCIVPLLLAVFSIAMIIGMVISLFNQHMNSGFLDAIKNSQPKVFFVLICSFLLVVNCIHLSRGGAYLLWEKETDSVQITGVVEKICYVDSVTGSKYGVSQNRGLGVSIYIEGQKYHVVSCEGVVVGDSVTVTFLPQSRFVLYLSKE